LRKLGIPNKERYLRKGDNWGLAQSEPIDAAKPTAARVTAIKIVTQMPFFITSHLNLAPGVAPERPGCLYAQVATHVAAERHVGP
jgi:hypothetical protein